MELRRLKTGLIFSVDAVVLNNGACPAEAFLERLRQNDLASHKSLVNILTRHADHGEMRNKKKSRVIEDRENLLEFKTQQGDKSCILLFTWLENGADTRFSQRCGRIRRI